jgi:DNA polymerase-3 subunit alpha
MVPDTFSRQLHEILRGYPGNCELELTLSLADGSSVPCKCGGMRIAVSAEMRARVDQLLGPGNFRLLTASPTAAGRGNGRASAYSSRSA